MPAATATSPLTPRAEASSPPPVAGPAPWPLAAAPSAAPFGAPSSAGAASAVRADAMSFDPPSRAAASSSPRRLAALPAAVAVSLVSLAFGAATALVMLAVGLVASGHDGLSLGARSAPAFVAGAGFACADAATVLVVWRRRWLHPAAVVVLWALALLAVASGMGLGGALVAGAGGALAIWLGTDNLPGEPDTRAVGCLVAAGCALSFAAGAIAPATHPDRPARRVAVPHQTGSLAQPPAPTATATPASSHGNAAAAGPSAAAGSSAATAGPSSPPANHSSPSQGAAPTRPVGALRPTGATTAPARPTGASTAPAAPLSAADVAAATQVIRNFYAALNAHRFTEAWAVLTPAVRTRFGGFSAWRAGYGTTLSSRPRSIRVTAAPGGGLLVRLTLVATDRARCGLRTARFAVRWELVRNRASWGAASLVGVALDRGTCG